MSKLSSPGHLYVVVAGNLGTVWPGHQHLNITAKEWEAMSADFKKTLDKFQVPEKEQSELFAIVESTKGDIVMSPR